MWTTRPPRTWTRLGMDALCVGLLSCTTSDPSEPRRTQRVEPQREGSAMRAARAAPRPRPATRRPPRRSTPARVSLDLTASAALVRDFVGLTKPRFAGTELGALFASLRRTGDVYCSMAWGERPFLERVAAKHIRRASLHHYRRRVRIGLGNIVAGCWNYFVMNDKQPHRDFQLVKQLYPRERFDCYAVGFVQPYLMHVELGCERLTFIDIDWRIHDAHYHLLRHFAAGSVTDVAGMRRAFADLHIRWIARGKGIARPPRPSETYFCDRHGQAALCTDYLPRFQAAFGKLREVRLNLSSLHDADFGRPSAALTKVVFVSNAIEKAYTKPKQFRRLLRRAVQALRVGQRAVFVCHVGSYRDMGIYEVTRLARGRRVRTRCRDHHCRTYFDHLASRRPRPPRCGKLLSVAQKK